MQMLSSLSSIVTTNVDITAAPLALSPDTERALADEKAALEAGFAVRPPLYAIGTAVNATGVNL